MIAASILLLAGGMVDLPPKQYEHRYRGKLVVLVLPEAAVHARCHGIENAHYRIMACAMPDKKKNQCVVVIPQVEEGIVSQAEQYRLRDHEIGHCNGWNGKHPGGRFNDIALMPLPK